MRVWVGFALWAHPKRLLNHWSHISSNLMNMQKRNSAKGNSRCDKKHIYWLCITVAVIYPWRLLVLQQSAATWLCVWYCFRLHKVIENGKNHWSMHSRSAVFLNNTKTPNFTFLGVKLGVHFAICWFSAFIAEREGFEPPDPLRSTVFKTAAFDHSAISPIFFPLPDAGLHPFYLKRIAKVVFFFIPANLF